MNNRDMIEFAKYFSHGVDQTMNVYQKGQTNAIARERNKIIERDRAATAADRARRTDIYGTSVENQGILARARAQKAIGGIGGPAGMSPQAKALIEKYQREGADMAAPAPAPSTNVTVQSGDGGDGAAISPPADSGMSTVPEAARGGMIRKFAPGGAVSTTTGRTGIVGDMSLEEAAEGGPGGHKSAGGPAQQGANMFSSTFKMPTARPAKGTPGPISSPSGGYADVGSGAGGSWGPQVAGGDSVFTPNFTGMKRGGMVRRFARGGVVQAIDTGTSGPGSGFGVPAAPPIDRRKMGGRNG